MSQGASLRKSQDTSRARLILMVAGCSWFPKVSGLQGGGRGGIETVLRMVAAD